MRENLSTNIKIVPRAEQKAQQHACAAQAAWAAVPPLLEPARGAEQVPGTCPAASQAMAAATVSATRLVIAASPLLLDAVACCACQAQTFMSCPQRHIFDEYKVGYQSTIVAADSKEGRPRNMAICPLSMSLLEQRPDRGLHITRATEHYSLARCSCLDTAWSACRQHT